MSGRPHESPDCRCAACARFDREQDQWPYGYWNDSGDVARYMRGCAAYEAERAAWQALVDLCDAVHGFARDDSRDDS